MSTMYSPKISEELVPVLYLTAKAQSEPMTTLVDRLLCHALAMTPLPPAAFVRYQSARFPPPIGIGRESLSTEKLEAVLQSPNIHPFRSRAEIDAWYSGAVHGLCRILRNHETAGELDQTGKPEFEDLYRALGDARHVACGGANLGGSGGNFVTVSGGNKGGNERG